ncbi:SDR family NAD(P)-dependent oxidoreductase [Mycolicibacterium tusciae]|uniref:SDR family NAD(P)-dependent oxidoreductase n=1 Tax=Mycolicibacterium tusciae TaxID=75922 RepID=UPI00024A5091|nr:SDR family oxidoreductase [Mycolicibacterium tusciae]
MHERRVAVVTGALSGIGEAITSRLLDDGMRVAALDLSVPPGMPPGGSAAEPLTVYADVTDPTSVEHAIRAVSERFGRVDVLINNAGITGSAEATDCHTTPVDEWERVLAVNVRGPFLCTRAVLPHMLQRRDGHVITIASAAGMVAFPRRCAYTTSKGAAIQFTKSIALDYAQYGIRANAVCPGMVQTPMTQWRLNQPALRSAIEAEIPMGRVAQPDEIADAVAVLASNRLGYMTGQTLVVDGGWTVH